MASEENLTHRELMKRSIQLDPIRCGPRAGAQAYYWSKQVEHKSLGRGTLVIQHRQLRSGRFQYRYYSSQYRYAKAITVLQTAKRRWLLEAFFWDTRQHLGMGRMTYRKWSACIDHTVVRSLVYFVLAKARRRWRWKSKHKSIGTIKRQH